MGRAIGGVVVGYALWSVLWLGLNAGVQAALPDIVDPLQPLTHTGVLAFFVVASVVISIGSGFVCAAVRGSSSMKSVQVLAAALLVTGIGAEVSYWAMTPVWYHLVFLALLVPATLWGGSLRAGKAAA